MATNPFKSFIPYIIGNAPKWLPDANADDNATDPSAGSWSTHHLVPPIDGEGLRVDLQGSSLMAVRFNERILPGKVRDEEVKRQVTHLEHLQGHKVSKKDYAQLRDQVEFDMLPRAFIRRTVVPVIFTGPYMLVCTSSAKRAESVAALLQSAHSATGWREIQTVLPVGQVLTTLARDGYVDTPAGGGTAFVPTDNAVLKGSGKRTIRIKDKDTQEADVQTLLEQEYNVVELGVELGVEYTDGEESAEMAFTVSERNIFKRCTLADVKMTPVKDDFHGFAVLCALTYRRVLNDWIAACGGVTQPIKPAAVDEDEL